MKRWLASRWLLLSLAAMSVSAYFVVAFPEVRESALRVFGEISMVALAGGHFTNGVRQSRGHPTVQPQPDDEGEVNL